MTLESRERPPLLVILPITFYVYARTSFPSLTGGDAGELLAEACQLGTPHPPGYPLFTMLIHTAMRISSMLVPGWSSENGLPSAAGAPALVANLLSCMFGSIAALFLALTVEEWNSRRAVPYASSAGAFAAAGLFSFSPLTWEYSIGAEVFALNNMLVMLILYLTVRVANETSSSAGIRWAYVGSFVCGLALSNQHTSLLAIIPLVGSVLLILNKEILRCPLKHISGLGMCALLGLLPYAYLVLRAHKGPYPGSWGDQRTISGFLRHVLRAEYGTFKMLTFGAAKEKGEANGPGIETGLERFVIYMRNAAEQTHGIGTAFFMLSIIASSFRGLSILLTTKYKHFTWKRDGKGLKSLEGSTDIAPVSEKKVNKKKGKKLKNLVSIEVEETDSRQGEEDCHFLHGRIGLIMISSFAFYCIMWNGVFSNLPLKDPMAFAVHSRFWMQPNALLCILAGDGIAEMLRKFCLFTRKSGSAKYLTGCRFMCGVFGICIAWWSCRSRWPLADQRRDGHGFTMHKYGEAILNVLPPNALLLSHTDLDWNSVRYLRQCEGRRPDVTHLSVQLLPYPWFSRQKSANSPALYPGVTFPPLFAGVSTHKRDEGNARLIEEFLAANWKAFGSYGSGAVERGLFIDMQCIDDVQINPRGAWRGLFDFVPHGPLYRVQLRAPNADASILHRPLALSALERMLAAWGDEKNRAIGGESGPPSPSRFVKGSWEFAAGCVHNDAIYQLSLFFLTTAIDLMNNITVPKLPVLLGTLHDAVRLMDTILSRTNLIDSLEDGPRANYNLTSAQEKYAQTPLSSSGWDLIKNAALAHMRLHSVVMVAVKNKDIASQFDADQQKLVLSERKEHAVTKAAILVIRQFVKDQPRDKDAPVFESALVQYEKLLRSEHIDAGEISATSAAKEGTQSDLLPKGKKRKKKKKKKVPAPTRLSNKAEL